LASTSKGRPQVVAILEALVGEEYGLGLLVRQVSCGTAYGQVGENTGYAIQAWTVPDKARTAVVVVTSGAAGADAEHLADETLCD
jgi:hypothetical protein